MKRWRFLFLFAAIAVGATTAIAALSSATGWTVDSPAWSVLAPLAMWAPAFARFVCRRTVDRGFTATLPLRRWGATGVQVILLPLLVPLVVYGSAYAFAWAAGLAHFNPGGGRWTTGSQIAANLLINLPLLTAVGIFTALGEELGWRGYLQPRLDSAGIRGSVAIVWLCQLLYHAPLMVGSRYADTGNLFGSLALFAVGDACLAYLWARESYRAGSLWPAVFFHSFHNSVSQWLFPKFFTGADDQFWLGETGVLPISMYVVVAVAVLLWARRRGPTWSALASSVSTTHPHEGAAMAPGVAT